MHRIREYRSKREWRSRVGVPATPTRLGPYESDGQRMVFISEESSRMHKLALGCWTSLLADAANVGLPGNGYEVQDPSKPTRFLSC